MEYSGEIGNEANLTYSGSIKITVMEISICENAIQQFAIGVFNVVSLV